MNIHVGNLPLHMTDRDLRALFEPCGTVREAEVIINVRTGEPLGYGFVMMESEDDGMKAIATLHGRDIKGKVLAVTIANRKSGRKKFRPRPVRPRV